MAVNGYRCLLTDASFRRAEILRLIMWFRVTYIFEVLFSVSVFFSGVPAGIFYALCNGRDIYDYR